MKKIFIDTEFTDFEHKRLISLGFTDLDSGESFYVECTDFDESVASDFVKEHIYPFLNNKKFGKTTQEAMTSAYEWLEKQGSAVIVGDWLGDWTVLKNHGKTPSNIEGFILVEEFFIQLFNIKQVEELRKKMDRFTHYCNKYYSEFNGRVHHALDDAQSNRWAFLQVLKEKY